MQYDVSKIMLASGLKDILIYRLSQVDSDACCVVEAYQNGRESGYTVSVIPNNLGPHKGVTITEYRRSDSIVVYLDNFADQGLNEKSYKSIKEFKPTDYNGVIEYCIKYLCG